MKPYDLFNLIKDANYTHVGLDGDYTFYISAEEKAIYILFEESCDKADWKHNFQFLPVPCSPYKDSWWYAHSGFCKVWKSMRDIVMKELAEKRLENPNYKIVCAGWSFGGAMAQFCAEDIAYSMHIIPTLITFGSPKIFYGTNNLFGDMVSDDSVMYCNGSDLVTICPPLPFYYHTLKNTQIGEKFNIFKTVKVVKYHTDYGNPALY